MSEMFIRGRLIVSVRKAHRCAQCKTSIEIGSPAFNHAGRGHCGFYAYYTCIPCAMPLTLGACEPALTGRVAR